ncbi:MAG: alpha/beta fold hydrolase [Actinobacteria bacterium]|nr:alpha/beta fold hydrolase [Actinomycetota bacterium]
MTAEARRTPDARFAGLPGFDFAPHYLDWEGLRLHYLDEGAGPPVVLFHGEPTWCFLYRKVTRALVDAGYRVIAPDYPGFGRSDKPVDPAFYTYDRHTTAMAAVVEHLELQGAAAVVQDWGGPIGLRLATSLPGRFTRLAVLNTSLFSGPPSEGFLRWRAFASRRDALPIGLVMRRSMVAPWSDAVVAAYEAPYPDPEYQAGVLAFPRIVPTSPGDPGAGEMRRVEAGLTAWTHPALVLFSTQDPIFSLEVGRRFAAAIPGAGPLETLDGAGHFLQEDRGEEVGRRLTAFLQRTD